MLSFSGRSKTSSSTAPPARLLLGSLLALLAVLILTAGAVLAGCAPRQGSLAAIRDKGVLVVGTAADYPPFEYRTADGRLDGFDIALIQEIARRLEVEVEFRDMEMTDLVDALAAGEVDVIIACLRPTPERDEVIDFTDPYYTSPAVFLVRTDAGIQLGEPLDVAGCRIGLRAGSSYELWAYESLLGPGLVDAGDLFVYESIGLAVDDLSAGVIDVVVTDSDRGARFLADEPGVSLALEAELFPGPAIGVTEGAGRLVRALNDIIHQLAEEGFIDQLEMTYIH